MNLEIVLGFIPGFLQESLSNIYFSLEYIYFSFIGCLTDFNIHELAP